MDLIRNLDYAEIAIDVRAKHQSRICRFARRLEESCWIERRADPKDRRANRIYLTSKADEINDEMTKTGQTLIDQTLRNLSADERETLINLLIAVKRNLLEDLPIEIDDVERQ